MIGLPASESFATGLRGEVLVLMVCMDWLWAGRLASPHSTTPVEVAACVGKRVRVRPRELQLGRGRFSMHPRALLRARRWLDRQGVNVREARP